MLLQKYEKQFPEVLTCLKKARSTGRLAHAYLIHSDDPDVREEFAILAAMIAACPEMSEDGSPCEVCNTCHGLQNDTYPEFYRLTPRGKMYMIKVGDSPNPEMNTLRWFEEMFYMTSTSIAGKKIGIVSDCDRMNKESQNAFLKTLEEPPSDTFFLLTTGNPLALLPTTRSRCQLLPLLCNHCRFEFNEVKDLFSALHQLQFSASDAADAELCAEILINVYSNLESGAKTVAENRWKQRLEQAEELDPPIKKRIIAAFEDAASGEFMRVRQYYVAAVHTWFAQVYLLACGGDVMTLANPEIFNEHTIPANLDVERTFKQLQQAEEFTRSMSYNMGSSGQQLAIRSFCMNAAKAH
jgi:DNA polymerase III subunit delta'